MSRYESKCFVYHGERDVRLEVDELDCGPTDLLVRVELCGRCGTDRRLYTTQHPSVRPPIVLGHEFVGRVVEVGTDVGSLREGVGELKGQTLTPDDLHFSPGERVTVQPKVCHYRSGLMLVGERIANLSFELSGAFSQYLRIPAEMIRSGSVIRVPDSISDEQAALIEPAACVLESIFSTPHPRGLDRDGRHVLECGIQPGGRTLVIGSGTLALLYGQFAKKEGAAEVFFVVRSPEKAELIRSVLGDWPRFVVVPDYSDRPIEERLGVEAELVASLADRTAGSLFDDVALAVPSLDAQRYAFELLNPSGYGAVALFAGLQQAGERVHVDRLHYRMASAVGTTGCSTRTMNTVVRWLADGEISLRGLTAARRFTLEDDPAEFFQTEASGLKPLLAPWE